MSSKFKQTAKRLLSGFVATVTAITMFPAISSMAEDFGRYPYTLFAGSPAEGSITTTASNFSVNGNVATNGTISTAGNMNINGTKTEKAGLDMIYIFDKIDSKYFSGSDVEEYTEDYVLDELNINISEPTKVLGEAELTGNININTALKAFKDVTLNGEVKNTNDSVIYSKYGDIVIESTNVNLNGLVYAPFGSVEVKAMNLNLNNVVIIADRIVFDCPNVNANYSTNAADFVGTVSEPLNIPKDEWQYMKDENENGLPDFFENIENWSKLMDTDDDGLPDSIEEYLGSDPNNIDTDGDGLNDYYEVFGTFTDPTKADTDDNGVNDGDEDFDEDGLTNLEEFENKTNPYIADTDSDGLSDGDEVKTHGTDPLVADTDGDDLEDGDEIVLGTNPLVQDTDGDGIIDSKEKFRQTFTHKVKNDDCAVTEVIVDMECTGNINRTTSVESVMNTDILCTDVVGLVGEPFEIETTSEFDKATLTFKIDKDKLGEIPFDNLLFLWYNEDENVFVELETMLDETNGTASISTTHFSKYMIVDKKEWFDAWSIQFNYNPSSDSTHYEPGGSYPTIKFNTALTIDCSGSMSWNDPTSQRIEAANKFIDYMHSGDKISVVFFTDFAQLIASMTNDESALRNSLNNVYSRGGTNFSAAINKAISSFAQDDIKASYVNNRIILLSDGDDGGSTSALNNALNACVDKKIKIFTVGFGSANDSILQRIADKTGGEYFKAFSHTDLVDIFAELGYADDFDMTDTDGDGLPDAVELAGIRLQNGRIIRDCDPTNPDTDGDGLPDGEEIDPKPFYSRKEDNGVLGIYKLLGINTVQGYYFKMYSNPIFADSDYDGIDDDIDPNPNNNSFVGKMHYMRNDKEKTCDVKFTVDYRRLFESNELYSEELANLSILFASDTYQDNYIQVTDGIPKGICGGDTGYEFGKLFGLEGEFITLNGDDYEVDNDDVTQFYIGYRPVFYQGEKRIIIVLSVRGTNSTNAEWSSNFDVGADTHEYYDLTGSHPYWKNKLNHKGFDVTMNRVLEKFDNYVSTRYLLSDSSIPKSILITGHSRGGAIANLLGAHFENDDNYKSFTYTFASPYTTTDTKASEYSTIMNIMNTDDLIPHLPLSDWGFQKYGRMFTISVEDRYEHKGINFLADSVTFEKLVGYDYNNDGGTQRTLENFSKIANNREELYIFDTSADGKVNLNNTFFLELSDAEAELGELRGKLKKYKLNRFCRAYIVNNGSIFPYNVEVNYCPAYLMQDLANLTTSKELKKYPMAGFDTKGKYADAKASFAWSSGSVFFLGSVLRIGGMNDPHMQPTYYLIAHNTLESQYDQ